MPEIVELMIMSDFVNSVSKDIKFNKIYHVQRENKPLLFELPNSFEEFMIKSDNNGKEFILYLNNDITNLKISVFMGMSGNWKWVPTDKWNETKFIRMRLDSDIGNSLILYGGYLGPKYRVGGFKGIKRGPDIMKEFESFKLNVIQNINNKAFDRPICEVLLDQRYFNGVGAYLVSEIVGRLDVDPFRNLKSFSNGELDSLFKMIYKCISESYTFGGGELISWNNPMYKSRIDEWIKFYNNKETCHKQKFGTRNIWIQNKFKKLIWS